MTKDLLELDPNAVYKQIEQELGKTKFEIEQYVKILQEWLKTQKHLPEMPEAAVIRSFLIFNKFSIERCKQKLDMYYSIRTSLPEMFDKHPCSPEMVDQPKITFVVPLPKLSKDNRRVIYAKLSEEYGTEALSHEKFVGHIFNVFEILLREDLFIGAHFIYDCAGFKLGHATKVNPMIMKKTSIVMEKVFSNRVTSIHIINFFSAFETALNIIKPLLPIKLQERLHVHRNSDALFDLFPKDILPKDVGGNEKCLADLAEQWILKLKENKDLFTKLQTMRVDESKRPSKLVNDEVLGFYGNFRKIEVD